MFTISRRRLWKKGLYVVIAYVYLYVSLSVDDSMHFLFKTQLPSTNQSDQMTICEVKQLLKDTKCEWNNAPYLT